MKHLLVALSIIASGAFATEYRVISIPYSSSLWSSEYVPLAIPAGQAATLIKNYNEIVGPTGGAVFHNYISYGDHDHKFTAEFDKEYEGPVIMWLGISTGTYFQGYNGTAYAIYMIKNTTDVNLKPMNIISLPEDNNGDMNLVIESSADLQTWTPVYSGSAGTSGTAAFFRTRLIKN